MLDEHHLLPKDLYELDPTMVDEMLAKDEARNDKMKFDAERAKLEAEMNKRR